MTLIEDFSFELDGLNRDNYMLYYFTQDMISKTSYKSHIVCCYFNNCEDLENYWNEVVDLAAMRIQARVPSMIEAYNIYIVFFCEDIHEALQFKIEQDKYSSRKIIVKTKIPENLYDLERLLEARLFSLTIPEDIGRSTDVDLYLREKGEYVYSLVSNVNGRVQDISDSHITSILAELGIEE